jgi:positive regulator of sigma E activity
VVEGLLINIMSRRFGNALILIGIILLIVFLLTTQIGQGELTILVLAAALSALGLLLRIRARRREEKQSRDRFRVLRRLEGVSESDPRDPQEK